MASRTRFPLGQFIVEAYKAKITHYLKYAKKWVFTDPDSPVQGQNRRFSNYKGECGSMKTRFLAYFMY